MARTGGLGSIVVQIGLWDCYAADGASRSPLKATWIATTLTFHRRNTTMKKLTSGVLASVLVGLAVGGCSRDVPFSPSGAKSANLDRGAATALVTPGVARVFTAAGDSADIAATVNAYRDALGNLNANLPGSRLAGRREINWDAVPANFTNTNDFPDDFFNKPPVPGRARGLVSTTDGTGFRVSDNNFKDLNDDFGHEFVFFSPIRTFAPVGSNAMTVTFFVPGTDTAATSTGFGVVFSDVDRLGSASVRFFDAAGRNLGLYLAPASPGGLSFVGVKFPAGVVARVEIRSGQAAVSPDASDIDDRDREPATDLVIMDDFIYGEPSPPSSGSLATREVSVRGLEPVIR